MTVRRRRSDRSGRSKLHSPGRPDSARREELVRFWAAIATGRSSEDAARDAGVSPPVGSRWFRRSGGMPPSHLSQSAKPLSGRYLSFEEREEIALLRAQGRGIRHIACRLERAPSTISREVRRNGRPEAVAWTTEQRRRSGILIDPPKGRSQPRWQRMRRCGPLAPVGQPVPPTRLLSAHRKALHEAARVPPIDHRDNLRRATQGVNIARR